MSKSFESLSNISNMNSKISKMFNNPDINFFIIMMLILIISCYTFINTPLKNAISSFIANPIVIVFSLICIVLISYYNINIAILVLLLLFIALYGSRIFSKNSTEGFHNLEGFTDDSGSGDGDGGDSSDDSEDEDEITNNIQKKITSKKSAHKQKEEDDAKTDEKIASIKGLILQTANSIKDNGENTYNNKLQENRQIQYLNEKKNNKSKQGGKSNFANTDSKSSSNSSSRRSKENFKTVKTRSFDPNKEEDTNLLITKEILQDMNNRIEYNFESNKYLKKYLKHRIEEIVEINKLLEDDE